jgi:hypothetical protein
MVNSSDRSLLLVDGYNVIGAWPSLKTISDRHGLEPAQDKLIETLIGYTHHQGYQTQIVFDSYLRDTPRAKNATLTIYRFILPPTLKPPTPISRKPAPIFGTIAPQLSDGLSSLPLIMPKK